MDVGDVWMVHHRQSLSFSLKATNDLLCVYSGLDQLCAVVGAEAVDKWFDDVQKIKASPGLDQNRDRTDFDELLKRHMLPWHQRRTRTAPIVTLDLVQMSGKPSACTAHGRSMEEQNIVRWLS